MNSVRGLRNHLEMFQQTYSNALRGSSFVEADKGLLSGLGFNVIGYDGATGVGRVSFA